MIPVIIINVARDRLGHIVRPLVARRDDGTLVNAKVGPGLPRRIEGLVLHPELDRVSIGPKAFLADPLSAMHRWLVVETHPEAEGLDPVFSTIEQRVVAVALTEWPEEMLK